MKRCLPAILITVCLASLTWAGCSSPSPYDEGLIWYNGEWVTVEEYEQIKSGEQSSSIDEPIPIINIPPASETGTTDTNTQSNFIYEGGAICVGGDNKPIELIDNPNAKDVTYEELIDFIIDDRTDEKVYSSWYVCADFAEDVHNNAEAVGIKAAWVGVDFENDPIGHAVNAFDTTDKGIVFIDCTGQSLGDRVSQYPFEPCEEWEGVAYVDIGKPYGIIPVHYAQSPSYDFYEQYNEKYYEYEQLLDDYNEEILRYNQEIRGKIYYEGSPELAEIEAWEAELDERSRQLDEFGEDIADCWAEPDSIVSAISIFWHGNG